MEIPSMLAAIGEVDGCAVLDAGCGTGVYARLLARRGADRVVGVDAAEGMLAVARALENQAPLGIDYRAGDISLAHGLGADLVVAVYLLPYARTASELLAVCQGLAASLRPGGRLVTAVLNPDYSDDPAWYTHYGFSLTSNGHREEGAPVVLSVVENSLVFEVTARYHSRQAMDSALSQAGFTDITWTAPHASPAGIQQHGQEFWANYLTCPHTVIVTARLPQSDA
ncbi:class I SAM-dependent methyltransferase [Streptomyces noboritoensis]|uniref:Class I SAM-dependent methyltransferase n=1 Tax=Streptomyces noboritoensis TaxID=67337 RepID=A0ABV6T9K4_9ACTN